MGSAVKVEVDLRSRVAGQINWSRRKVIFNQTRRRVFLVIAIVCELAAAGLAVALLVHLVSAAASDPGLKASLRYLLIFLWPFLAAAAASLGWVGFRRFGELERIYQQTAVKPEGIRREIEKLLDPTPENRAAFERGVHECEELLTTENSVWFARRSS